MERLYNLYRRCLLGKFFNLHSINKIRKSDPRLLREVGDLKDLEGDSEALLQAVRLVK
jgi:hypothetical protein